MASQSSLDNLKIIRVAAICGVLWLCNLSGICAQQLDSRDLQITSPAANAIVNPGQTVQVVVTPSAGIRLHRVAIVSEQPNGFNALLNRPPFVFSLTPPGSRLGSYLLTAWAVDENRRTVVSTPVSIDIEPAVTPVAITALMSQLIFRSPGQELPLRIMATFPDGSVADATESSNVAYASANTSLATVDSHGLVTALASGATSITVTYGESSNLKITIPVSVQRAAAGIASASIVFSAQQVGNASAPQKVEISNQANGPITIRSVQASGDFIESNNCVSASPLAAGGSCTAMVTFTPSAVGSRAGRLTVSDSFDEVSPSIALTGIGVPVPSFFLSVTPASEKVSRDHPATYLLTVTPIGGFAESVHLTCTGQPRVTTCSISPATVKLDGKNPVVATVTVSFDRDDHVERTRSDHDEDHSEQEEHRKSTLTFEGIAGNITRSTQAGLIVDESRRRDRD